jgi:hypothetical protein
MNKEDEQELLLAKIASLKHRITEQERQHKMNQYTMVLSDDIIEGLELEIRLLSMGLTVDNQETQA